MLIQFQATIRKIETIADRGLRLRVDTQELPGDSVAVLYALKDGFGSMAFKVGDAAFTEDEAMEIPDVKVEFSTKSPSERFRNVLYVFHKQKKITENFNTWYVNYMENLIQEIKDQLDPE